jgi:hypothetical protein
MDHFSRIGEAHFVATAVCNDDGARRFIGFVPRPVALKLQKNLPRDGATLNPSPPENRPATLRSLQASKACPLRPC